MRVDIVVGSAAGAVGGCLIAFVQNRGGSDETGYKVISNDDSLHNAAAEVLSSNWMTPRLFDTAIVTSTEGLAARRLLLINIGSLESLSSEVLRAATGTAIRVLRQKGIKDCVIVVPEVGLSLETNVRCIVEAAIIADFDPDFKMLAKRDIDLERLALLVANKPDVSLVDTAAKRATILGESQNYARRLANEPSNKMTPSGMANSAIQMCEEVGLKCEILDEDDIRRLNMQAFLSVARGSAQPPRLIIIRHEPEASPRDPLIGLVGKGVTFDSGGLSLKAAEGLDRMKFDMSGGAAALGAIRALSLTGAPVNVVAIICACENMPSGSAQRPGDIEQSMAGRSIEISNTDAEGRILLAEGLHFAKELGCTHLVDVATLTKACVIALGAVNGGIFANDEEIHQRFSKAASSASERFWRLPLDPLYVDQMRTSVADLRNSAGPVGDAVTAAAFLSEFVGKTPWIHLDIAGVAWIEDARTWIGRGASGAAVRSIVEFIASFSDSSI